MWQRFVFIQKGGLYSYHPSTDDHSPNGHVIQISGFFGIFWKNLKNIFLLFLAVFGYFLIFLTPEYEYSYPGDQFWFNKSFRRPLFDPKMANFIFDFFLCPTQKRSYPNLRKSIQMRPVYPSPSRLSIHVVQWEAATWGPNMRLVKLLFGQNNKID